MGRMRAVLAWSVFAAAIAVPVTVALSSPLLAWRQPVYIAAGLAGILGLAIILAQPLLAAGYLPGLPAPRGRRIHRWTGAALVGLVLAHVGGLWLTSPPDVIDALLFRSPTPFSAWGVVAMWAILAAAILASLRRRLRLRPGSWRLAHMLLTSLAVIGSVVHAILIEGTMGTISKWLLCALVIAATAKAFADLRTWAALKRLKT